MPHGGPDWGTGGTIKTVHTIEDLGELAARLGSPVTFDRRGNVIAYDNFENGIEQWVKFGDAGYSIDWDSQYYKTGGFSCKLTTTGIATARAIIHKHIGYPSLSIIGLEFSHSYKQNWQYLIGAIWVYDGAHLHLAEIIYDHPNFKLLYRSHTSFYEDIPGGLYSCRTDPECFDTLKFVADFTTGKYKRLLVNSQVFDLSDLRLYITPSPQTPHMLIRIELRTNVNAPAIAYIDDVIITQNEP